MTDKNIIFLAEQYIGMPDSTVRKIADISGWSKSTVHNVLTSDRLKELDRSLFYGCQKLLHDRFATKHIKGGEVTKRKYKGVKRK